MRSHRFINSLLYLVIQLVANESKAKENNAGIRSFFVLFLDKRYISQVIHFNRAFTVFSHQVLTIVPKKKSKRGKLVEIARRH